ncbi:MAG: hypothetical protein IPK32_15630 [Verrucomicrobiaceae bacterium]|nr:hypothetical protein [Verrucomicrobiaceae bacterium]
MHDHILSTYNASMDRLRQDVLAMASMARKNLACALRGLLERDTDLCNASIAADQDVNELEKAVDKLGMQVLVKFQPTAHDLRAVMGTIRVANNIERIADQASSIAKRARIINNLPEIPEVKLIQPVYELCARNLEASIQAFIDGDSEAAAAARKMDKNRRCGKSARSRPHRRDGDSPSGLGRNTSTSFSSLVFSNESVITRRTSARTPSSLIEQRISAL